MRRWIQLYRQLPPEERKLIFGHAWWAMTLAYTFAVMLWFITPA